MVLWFSGSRGCCGSRGSLVLVVLVVLVVLWFSGSGFGDFTVARSDFPSSPYSKFTVYHTVVRNLRTGQEEKGWKIDLLFSYLSERK